MFIMNDAKRKMVMETLRSYNMDFGRAAKKLHMKEIEIRWVADVETGKFKMTAEGRGPVRMQHYIVQVKHRDEHWDNTHPDMVEARAAYEDGVVELVNGKDGWNDILYAIPRKIKAKARPYFSIMSEEDQCQTSTLSTSSCSTARRDQEKTLLAAQWPTVSVSAPSPSSSPPLSNEPSQPSTD